MNKAKTIVRLASFANRTPTGRPLVEPAKLSLLQHRQALRR
jgi:hypothetical protein